MTDMHICPAGMVYIPAGTFRMGSHNGDSDEKPVRGVYVSAFCMDKHEVTRGEFRRSHARHPRQPEVPVSWKAADAFCKARGKRLPTEAEWEKAARGPENFEYGTRSGELNHEEAYYGEGHGADGTVDVCSYPENGYGLCDMAGNAAEWVADWYYEDSYSAYGTRDPRGPSEGEEKVYRGDAGGAYYAEEGQRVAGRSKAVPNHQYDGWDFGFRCAAAPLRETGETSQNDIEEGVIDDPNRTWLTFIANVGAGFVKTEVDKRFPNADAGLNVEIPILDGCSLGDYCMHASEFYLAPRIGFSGFAGTLPGYQARLGFFVGMRAAGSAVIGAALYGFFTQTAGIDYKPCDECESMPPRKSFGGGWELSLRVYLNDFFSLGGKVDVGMGPTLDGDQHVYQRPAIIMGFDV